MLVTFTRRAAREMVQRAGAASPGSTCGRHRGDVPRRVPPRSWRGTARWWACRRRSRCSTRRTRPRCAPWRATPSWPAARPARRSPKPGDHRRLGRLAAESGRDIEEVVLEPNPRLGDRMESLRAIAEGYEERKRAMGAVDYADLLVLAVRLLDEHPGCATRLPERYRWVLVDELHDVNPVQARMVEALTRARRGTSSPSPTPTRSIYSWRGADPEVVDPLRRRPGHARLPAPDQLPLARPRSWPWPRRPARRATRSASASAPWRPPRASRRWWRTWPPCRRRRGSSPSGSPTSSPTGRAPGEIAVLYRAHHHSVDLQLALAAGGRGVRALLGRAVRRERPREGRPRVLPPAPQPPRRARLEPGAAAVRAGSARPSPRGRGRDRGRARPARRRRRPAPSGRGRRGLAPVRGGGRATSPA